jgi:hypothetical protein
MAILENKWIRKEASKHSLLKPTAPSYAPQSIQEFEIVNLKKPIKRHTQATRANIIKTLRGVRK